MLYIINITIALFCAIFLLSIALTYYYAAPSVATHTKITSILTWVLTFGLVLLVPLDLFITIYLSPL